jgi:hypothetical protein
MQTVILLTQDVVSLDRFVEPLRARVGGDVYYTSASRLAVSRNDELGAFEAGDETMDDYEDGELEVIGQRRDTVHPFAVEFRRVAFLREMLLAVQSEVGVAWVDNDHGVILPLAEFIARIGQLDDYRNL